MGSDAMGREGYRTLKDLRLEIEGKEGTFSICFWVYLMNSTTFPAIILHQVHSDISQSAPFLIINENKRVNILPVLFLHEEAPDTGSINSWTEVPHATVDFEFSLEKWVHVGCEVCPNNIRLQINGEIVAKKSLSSLLNKESNSSDLKKITLANVGGNGNNVQGYVHNFEVFHNVSFIKDHHLKDPPLKLSIDESAASEVEEESGGIWGIVGGKASCRRNFSLDVVLSDAFGQPVDKENEVFASLVYADTGAPVENTSDDEAPLLSSYDGIEFSSRERPSKLLLGRASFKLRISQLSSKCDNRLFLIRFCVPKLGNYPFLQTNTCPIRCISRSRNTRLSTLVWKRSTYALQRLNLSQSSAMDDRSLEHTHSGHEEKTNPLMKRFRVGLDKISVSVNADSTKKQSGVECNSHVWIPNQVENGFPRSLDGRSLNFEEDAYPSESESIGERNSPSNSMGSRRYPISDITIFKYCLAGLTERSLMLKEIATSSSDREISELAHQVSHYSGCSHHGNQILSAKRLIEDGTNLWRAMSANNHHVPWESAVYEIEEQFMKIASCGSRSFSHQDLEILRRIAGCQEYLTQENFEKLWCWLYPVACIISRDWVNPIWNSTSPKWIEGFITKEEAEASLQGPAGFQEPGTFILRFPTSRSWPHPDAGSLIVTYIGKDYKLRHRLLSMDHIYGSDRRIDVKPLQDMLLAEPELSRLGRTMRSYKAHLQH
ncbi:SH2 domain-containing protein A-like isoform X2 [Cicer arietinum]|uniref:SH2 domain-containing protein A-like isoform X2 n=1 Tax=Cicer arietinum TaxID=3827 RepID=A0A1S3EGT5_CICAR|nr:SH2 domain-containing protein A-like isoform X2 [Cicer arietinum]